MTTNTDAVPLPCPMCNASLTDASASGYHYHPANDCVFSGFEVSCDDVAAWNRRHPDVPTADDGEIWPSATVIVDEQGNVTSAKLYAPGLPAGRHDLFPVRVPYMEEHTEAWLAVSDALRAVDPDYLNGHGNAIEQAVAAIRRLAASVAPSAAAAQADHIADERKMVAPLADALEWHWSTNDEGPMTACGTDDVAEALRYALYESGIATFGEDQTNIFLCRFRSARINFKRHAERILESIDEECYELDGRDKTYTDGTDSGALEKMLSTIVKVDALIAYDECEFAPGDENYKTALLRVRNDAAAKRVAAPASSAGDQA